ncbi:uncharacterized protein [Physcomitrium patens]|uniref:Uncharacterized protein n=2 Tax=Physcomitrium patens TaxID=3218 RepID=A0A7I4FPE4_PHYPA|nr:uncharacterized protein LOC112281488 [Physcomitrium patens]XP_024373842.1 uncharacterized protein LOC112281488 [Physcomitrium patens]|eukprot:XP_024373841.1 uncharacterized protein LOC112281488 [Physcomitrella patens]
MTLAVLWHRSGSMTAFRSGGGARIVAELVLLSWIFLTYSSGGIVSAQAAQPEKFPYYNLWASQDGETHFAACNMQGFNLTPYASLPQYLRTDFGGEPIEMVFTELPVALDQPLHSPPQVQFVITLSGSWFTKTSDGTRHEYVAGDIMFQDNTKNSSADKQPQHYSGTVGDVPCHQLVVQISRPPQVDSPCPF